MKEVIYPGCRLPMVPDDQAALGIDEFLDHFSLDAHFFTNGTWDEGRKRSSHSSTVFGPSWASATKATFDAGVIILDVERSGILWLEDED